MKRINRFLNFFDTLPGLALLAVLIFSLRLFVFQPFLVEGQSMEPNLHNRQYLIVDRLFYQWRGGLRRGQVVVFHPPTHPEQSYIKRVIGLPGDKVNITDGQIYINGVKLSESYLEESKTFVSQNLTGNLEQILAANQYFVMGDNRSHSSDSREWGVLPQENIIGRAGIVLFPIPGVIKTPTYQSLAPKL